MGEGYWRDIPPTRLNALTVRAALSRKGRRHNHNGRDRGHIALLRPIHLKLALSKPARGRPSPGWHARAMRATLLEQLSADRRAFPDGHTCQLDLVVAFLSVLVKENMYRYTLRDARKMRSNLLQTNAWHHRSEAL